MTKTPSVFAQTLLSMCLAMSASSALARPPSATDIDYFTDSAQLLSGVSEQLSVLDPQGDADWTSAVPGAIRTQTGLQILPSCLKSPGLSAGELAQAADRWADEIASRVLSCRKTFPELDRYLLPWITRMRRIKVDCRPDSPNDPHPAYDVALSHTIHAEQSVFLYDRHSMVHEILHETNADNLPLWEHSSQSFLNGDAKKPCGSSAANDRVYVLESLCGGVGLFHGEHASSVLDRKMSACGAAVGCESLFTGSLLGVFNPSGAMPTEDAKRLCKRIGYDARCRQKALSEFGRDREFREVARLLQQRARALAQKKEHEIPAAFVAAFPTLRARYESLKNGPCFKAVFATDPDGALEPTGLAQKTLPPADVLGFQRPNITISTLAAWMQGPAWHAPEACSARDAQAVQAWVGDLQKTLETRGDSSWVLANALNGHMQPQGPDRSDPQIVKELESVFDPSACALGQLVGKDLLERYLHVVAATHPASERFSCASEWAVANGLSELLERGAAPERSCP